MLEGREHVGAFRHLTFEEKITLIASDLQTHHWHKGALIIANSIGAYLFLHAQSMLPAFVGKVVLLSPIIGEAFDPATNRVYVPPRAGKLQQYIEGVGSTPRSIVKSMSANWIGRLTLMRFSNWQHLLDSV